MVVVVVRDGDVVERNVVSACGRCSRPRGGRIVHVDGSHVGVPRGRARVLWKSTLRLDQRAATGRLLHGWNTRCNHHLPQRKGDPQGVACGHGHGKHDAARKSRLLEHRILPLRPPPTAAHPAARSLVHLAPFHCHVLYDVELRARTWNDILARDDVHRRSYQPAAQRLAGGQGPQEGLRSAQEIL